MSKEVSIAEAKKGFSAWVRTVEHGASVVITRRGKAVAALVGIEEFEQLLRLRAAGPDAGLAGLVGGWEGSDEWVEQVLQHERTQGRQPPDLD